MLDKAEEFFVKAREIYPIQKVEDAGVIRGTEPPSKDIRPAVEELLVLSIKDHRSKLNSVQTYRLVWCVESYEALPRTNISAHFITVFRQTFISANRHPTIQ